MCREIYEHMKKELVGGKVNRWQLIKLNKYTTGYRQTDKNAKDVANKNYN